MSLQQHLHLGCHGEQKEQLLVLLKSAAPDLHTQSLCAQRVARHWLSLKVAQVVLA